MKFLSKAICCFSLQNLPHMQLAISLSFTKLLWPLVRFISYSHDQDHVHVFTTCYDSTLEVSKISSIHKIKLPDHVWHHSLSKIYQGYGAMQKENKKCIPKEDMPHASACQKKKKERIKYAYPKKVCHMLRHVKKKKEEDSPLSKKKEKERWCIQRSSYTIHQKKYPHTCTSWSRFMTCFFFGSGLWLSKIWEEGMPSNLLYLQLHKNSHWR